MNKMAESECGLQMEYTSSKLSPKEKSGIEDVHESSNSRNDVSTTDLSMEHGDLKSYQDINKGFESNEDFQTQESDWVFCSLSSMEDCDRFDTETADAPDESQLMSKISPFWESSPNAGSPRTWIEIGRWPPMMVRTLVSVVCERLQNFGPDMSRHFLATKNTIVDQLKRTGNCDEMVTSAKLKHVQLPARSRETFNLDDLPTLGEVEECAEVAKDILNDAEQLMENIKKLMDNAQSLENSEKSMDKAEEMVNFASKLIGVGEKLMQNSEKLSEIGLKWEGDLRNEDIGNGYTFLAKLLVIVAIFVALGFALSEPIDPVPPEESSVIWQFTQDACV